MVGFYDRFMSPVERASLAERRNALIGNLNGRILEVGAGTGANLGYYRSSNPLIAVEPDPGMYQVLKEKIALGCPQHLAASTVEQLPFRSGSFDVVVSTLVLCSVKDPVRSLSEIRRVLSDEGRLVFIEHVRSKGRAGKWQSRLQPLWTAVGGGCHPDRQTIASISESGFELESLESFNPFENFSAPLRWLLRIVVPFTQGVAVKVR